MQQPVFVPGKPGKFTSADLAAGPCRRIMNPKHLVNHFSHLFRITGGKLSTDPNFKPAQFHFLISFRKTEPPLFRHFKDPTLSRDSFIPLTCNDPAGSLAESEEDIRFQNIYNREYPVKKLMDPVLAVLDRQLRRRFREELFGYPLSRFGFITEKPYTPA